MKSLHVRGLTLLIFAFVNFATGFQATAAAGTEESVYVAPNGNDQWTGKLDAPNGTGTDGPFATLERALQAVRQQKADGKPMPAILIRSGTYFPGRTLEIRPEDSGTAGRPLRIAAYPGELPVFDSGVRLSGTWKKDAGGPLWTLQLSGTVRAVDDLYVNGRKMPRARFPHTGFLKATGVGESKTQFQFKPGDLPEWPDAAGAVVVIKPYEWSENTLPIQSIDHATHIVTTSQPGSYQLASNRDPASGDYYIENIRAGLNGPGDWCRDGAKGVLIFWPPEGLDPNQAEIVAGGSPIAISVLGDVARNQWVKHVVLERLTFRHAGRYEKWRFYGGAAVRFTHNASDCEVRRCRIEDTGGCGVVVWKECRNIAITGNEFARTGDTAIKIFDYLGEGSPVGTGDSVVNNSIHDCGTVARDITGIEIAGVNHTTVAHNLVFNLPYIGLRATGVDVKNWPAKATPDLKPPFTEAQVKPFEPTFGNIFEYNHVHHVMRELRDGGGIYFWGMMGNGPNIIRNNLIEHVGEGKGIYVGIYLDDHCDDVQCSNNIIVDAAYGLHLHGASRNILENNVFAWSRFTDISVQPEKYNIAPMDSVLRRNIFFGCAGKIFLNTSYAPWDRKPLAECDYNLYWADGREIVPGEGNFAGFDSHSLVADPGFKDAKGGDFSFGSESPAAKLGIHPVDVAKAGLNGPVGPANAGND